MSFEVYVATHNGETLYVGEGRRGRSDHVKSGVSNIYQLNKLHFAGEFVEVVVYQFPTKEGAVEKEQELIEALQPVYNTAGTEQANKLTYLRRELKKFDAVHGEDLVENYTYGVIKAAIRNMDNTGKCIIKPVDVRIACSSSNMKHNPCTGFLNRFNENPNSKTRWFVSEFSRAEGVGCYKVVLQQDIFEQGVFMRRLRDTFTKLRG